MNLPDSVKRFFVRIQLAVVVWLVMAFCLAAACSAQNPDEPTPAAGDPAATMLPHSKTAHWWVSGQDNIISQWHPSFTEKYSGPNSFRSQAEPATSNVATLFTGLQLTRTTELFTHFEAAAGGGLSDALALAGFTDLDVARNPTLGISRPAYFSTFTPFQNAT